MEGGFGGEVPCAAVTTTGELKYYIIGSEAGGTPVATAGSLKNPYKVRIKNKISGDKPSLPGQDPPKKCIIASDCPPGLPGCETARGDKEEGRSCDATSECRAGLVCLNGECTPGDDGTAPTTGGQPWSTKGAHHYISLGGQLDLAYIASAEDVCSKGSSATYVCTRSESDGDQFFGTPGDVKGTNGISGGLALAGGRILAGYDFEFDFDVVGLGLGVRVGYAFGGPQLSETSPDEEKGDDPKFPKGNSFLPFHGEGRVQLRFLNPSMQGGDFAPHAFVGFGGGQVNASVPVTVCNTTDPEPGDNERCPGETKVDAYQLTGLTFASFGGGATYMIVDNFGISADLKFMVLFPTVGFVIAPSISPVVAF
jgi:hypothetical protein